MGNILTSKKTKYPSKRSNSQSNQSNIKNEYTKTSGKIFVLVASQFFSRKLLLVTEINSKIIYDGYHYSVMD